jgi:hypothetical protein
LNLAGIAHPWKHWVRGTIPFKKNINSPWKTRCLTLLLLTFILLFQEM